MTTRRDYEKAREEHKKGGPYKSALHAIESKTFSKMHNARKDLAKQKALKKMKSNEKRDQEIGESRSDFERGN